MKACKWIMLLALLTCLCACGTEGEREETFVFTYHGVEITPGEDAAAIIAGLGEAKSITEEPSCAFQGMDRTYCYGSFYLTTIPGENGEMISSVWFADDTVITGEGLRIGSTRQEVEAVFGSGCIQGASCTVIRGNTRLTLRLEDEKINVIRYDALIE